MHYLAACFNFIKELMNVQYSNNQWRFFINKVLSTCVYMQWIFQQEMMFKELQPKHMWSYYDIYKSRMINHLQNLIQKIIRITVLNKRTFIKTTRQLERKQITSRNGSPCSITTCDAQVRPVTFTKHIVESWPAFCNIVRRSTALKQSEIRKPDYKQHFYLHRQVRFQ